MVERPLASLLLLLDPRSLRRRRLDAGSLLLRLGSPRRIVRVEGPVPERAWRRIARDHAVVPRHGVVVDPLVPDLRSRSEHVLRDGRSHDLLTIVDRDEDLRQRAPVLEDRALLDDQVAALLADDCSGPLVVEGENVVTLQSASSRLRPVYPGNPVSNRE